MEKPQTASTNDTLYEFFSKNYANLVGFKESSSANSLPVLILAKILVDNIFLNGLSKRQDFTWLIYTKISGGFICFFKKNWALKFLFRLVKFGENAVGVKRLEGDNKIVNYDCSDFVSGHLEYRPNMKMNFTRIGIYWELELNDL